MLLTSGRLLVLLAILVAASMLVVGCGGDGDSSTSDSARAAQADDDAARDEEAGADESDDAVAAGIAYEDATLPLINELKPLLQRYDTTTDKLIDGSIDVARGTEAFAKQAAAAKALAVRVRAVDIDDEHLMEANEQLTVSFDRYASAMTVMTGFNDGMSDAQIEQTMSKATAELDEMITALDTWSDALVEDPEGRTFSRTGVAFTEISTFIDSL